MLVGESGMRMYQYTINIYINTQHYNITKQSHVMLHICSQSGSHYFKNMYLEWQSIFKKTNVHYTMAENIVNGQTFWNINTTLNTKGT